MLQKYFTPVDFHLLLNSHNCYISGMGKEVHCNANNLTSQHTGKAYDYTIVIAVVHWLKGSVIVKKFTLTMELWLLCINWQ